MILYDFNELVTKYFILKVLEFTNFTKESQYLDLFSIRHFLFVF